MTVPESLVAAEQAPLIGPDALRLREVLDALCLSDDEETAGRALLRRTELRVALASIALSRAATEASHELANAIEDVQAAGSHLEENTDAELQARLLAGRVLVRTLRTGAASELLHGTRKSVKGTGRRTRLMMEMLEGELALDTRAYADADRHLRRAVGLARGPAVAHDHYQACMGLAAAHQLQDNAPGAVPWLRLARQTAIKHADGPRTADACFSLGGLLLAASDVEGAERAMNEAVQAGLEPNSLPMALMALTRIDLGLGRYEQGVQRAVAAAQAGAAVNNAAAFADGAILAAQCQMGLELTDDALQTCDAGIKVLREQGHDDFAELVERQKHEILHEEGLAPAPDDDAGADAP